MLSRLIKLVEKYIQHLLSDIVNATVNVAFPFAVTNLELNDWISNEEEKSTAPIRNLQKWTGISKELLPPHDKLNDAQVLLLLDALKIMLDAYNCSFVLQTAVPERIQYSCIRENFNQDVKVKQWHMGFFELCMEGTEHGKCSLGEYCQCAFYAELFSGFIDDDLTPEEERAKALEIEIIHLQKKYDDDWMKYYPYHLDKNYDDENGHPYDYGFGDRAEEEDNDDWWRK